MNAGDFFRFERFTPRLVEVGAEMFALSQQRQTSELLLQRRAGHRGVERELHARETVESIFHFKC